MEKVLTENTPESELFVGCPLYTIHKSQRLDFLMRSLRKGNWVSKIDMFIMRTAFKEISNDLIDLWSGTTKCYLCNSFAKHRHHVVPICRGGTNVIGNLVPLCIPCHDKFDVRVLMHERKKIEPVHRSLYYVKGFKSPFSKEEKVVVVSAKQVSIEEKARIVPKPQKIKRKKVRHVNS